MVPVIVGVGIVEVLSSVFSCLSSHVMSGLEISSDCPVMESSPKESSNEDGKTNENSMGKGDGDVGLKEQFLESVFPHRVDPRVMEPRLHLGVTRAIRKSVVLNNSPEDSSHAWAGLAQ